MSIKFLCKFLLMLNKSFNILVIKPSIYICYTTAFLLERLTYHLSMQSTICKHICSAPSDFCQILINNVLCYFNCKKMFINSGGPLHKRKQPKIHKICFNLGTHMLKWSWTVRSFLRCNPKICLIPHSFQTWVY